MTRKLVSSVAISTALLAGGGVAAAATHDGGGSVPLPQRHRATSAALAATGGGTANSVERDAEDGATWEVEVIRTDGRAVDVRLDVHYRVVVIEGDHEDAGRD